MSPLRYRMIEDMQVRNLAPDTQRAYLQQITQFACHFGKSPEILGPAEIRAYQLYLTRDRQLSASSILVAVSALRFIYKVTLKRRWSVDEVIPVCRKPQKLPVVMSQGRGLPVSRRRQEFEASRHSNHLLRGWAAGLRSGPPDSSGDRPPAHGHPRGGGQRAKGSLRDALAQAAGHSPKLLAVRPPEGVAVSRRSTPTTDLDVRSRARLQEGEAPIQYRQTSHTPLPAPRLCRPPA